MKQVFIAAVEVRGAKDRGGIGNIPYKETFGDKNHEDLMAFELAVATATNAINRLESEFVLVSIEDVQDQRSQVSHYLVKLDPATAVARYVAVAEPVFTDDIAKHHYESTSVHWQEFILTARPYQQ